MCVRVEERECGCLVIDFHLCYTTRFTIHNVKECVSVCDSVNESVRVLDCVCVLVCVCDCVCCERRDRKAALSEVKS